MPYALSYIMSSDVIYDVICHVYCHKKTYGVTPGSIRTSGSTVNEVPLMQGVMVMKWLL